LLPGSEEIRISDNRRECLEWQSSNQRTKGSCKPNKELYMCKPRKPVDIN
jgi:hypothetical protein